MTRTGATPAVVCPGCRALTPVSAGRGPVGQKQFVCQSCGEVFGWNPMPEVPEDPVRAILLLHDQMSQGRAALGRLLLAEDVWWHESDQDVSVSGREAVLQWWRLDLDPVMAHEHVTRCEADGEEVHVEVLRAREVPAPARQVFRRTFRFRGGRVMAITSRSVPRARARRGAPGADTSRAQAG